MASSNRRPSAIMDQDRTMIGAKVECLLVSVDRELGCIEAGRSLGNNTTKEFNDGLLKQPKILKDMLAQLAKERPKVENNLVTVGFTVMGHRVQLLEMDWPIRYPHATTEFSSTLYNHH
ncbi:unnamed protein product [Absidia cylindrospora]